MNQFNRSRDYLGLFKFQEFALGQSRLTKQVNPLFSAKESMCGWSVISNVQLDFSTPKLKFNLPIWNSLTHKGENTPI